MKFYYSSYYPWLRRKKTRSAAAAAAAGLKKSFQDLSQEFEIELQNAYGETVFNGGNSGSGRFKIYEFTIVRAYLEDDDSYRRLWPDYRVLIAFNSLLLFLLTGGRLEPSRYFKFHRSLGSAATVFQDDDFFIFPCDADTDIEVKLSRNYLVSNFTKGVISKASAENDYGTYGNHPDIDVAGLCQELKQRFRKRKRKFIRERLLSSTVLGKDPHSELDSGHVSTNFL